MACTETQLEVVMLQLTGSPLLVSMPTAAVFLQVAVLVVDDPSLMNKLKDNIIPHRSKLKYYHKEIT